MNNTHPGTVELPSSAVRPDTSSDNNGVESKGNTPSKTIIDPALGSEFYVSMLGREGEREDDMVPSIL